MSFITLMVARVRSTLFVLTPSLKDNSFIWFHTHFFQCVTYHFKVWNFFLFKSGEGWFVSYMGKYNPTFVPLNFLSLIPFILPIGVHKKITFLLFIWRFV
jgi:hypothetical protein